MGKKKSPPNPLYEDVGSLFPCPETNSSWYVEMFFNKECVASNVLKLSQNPISIPVSTVGMERIFSAVDNLWINGFNRLKMQWEKNETRALQKSNS